jgi:hypothetical protein
MDDKDDRLSKEELQYLIEKLSLSDEESATSIDMLLESSAADQGAVQADLKLRLQRGVEEMRARNEVVPEHLLNLIKRL